jgi:hypothetical protein
MTLFIPYGLNSSLKDTRSAWGPDAAALAKSRQFGELDKRLEKIAKRGELEPHQKAATIGKMLMSGQLRVGAGANGGATLHKRAAERNHFPIRHDDNDRARFNQRFSAALAKLPGHAGAPQMDWLSKMPVTSGVGAGVRKQVAANNSNLLPLNMPGTQGPQIDENALEILAALPDGRVRQGVINAVMLRPPQNPNDAYRWVQTIVALRDQINEMCEGMGLDPTALTDLLDRRVEFYDPMVQTKPATNPARERGVGNDPDHPEEWPTELVPPAEPVDLREPDGRFRSSSFAGADRTDSNPDFREEKLAKFFDAVRDGRAVAFTRGEDGSLAQLRRFGEIVVKSELEGALQKQVLQMSAARKRIGAAAWQKVMKEPAYAGLVRAIVRAPTLSRSMKGAALSLLA